MSALGWTETVPSNSSLVGNAPKDFKSVWTALAFGMATEHYFPGSGGGSDASAGELLPGASRCFVDLKSKSSAPNSQYTGRFFLDTDNSRLYAYESAATYMVGSSWYNEHATDASTSYWVRTSGSIVGVGTGSGTTAATFPLLFLSAPTVTLSGSNTSWAVSIVSTTTAGFTSAYSSFAGAASTLTIYWQALGLLSQASV